MRSLHPSIVLIAALSAVSPSKAQFGSESQLLSEGPRSIDLSDLDNDGDADLTIGAREGTLFRLNADGLGGWAQPLFMDASMVVARVVDLNGDGAPDVVGGLDFGGGLRWRMNMGTLGFGPAQSIAAGVGADLIRHADIDADGDQDVLVALENGAIAWSENTDGQGAMAPLATICATGSARSLQAADLDGDGDQDVIWSSWMTGELHCAFNAGNSLFSAPQVLASEGQGRCGDIDMDGHLDVVAGDAQTGELRWRRNTTGNGLLSAPQDIGSATTDLEQMLVEDLDADGDLDLVVSSALLDEIAWYENLNGQGTYGPRQVIGVNVENAVALASGDVDGDGDDEVFAASSAQNRVVWYENLTYSTGRILGRVFNDLDSDGVFNGNDHGLADVQVTVPGVGAVFTNHSGMYWIEVPTGSFAVQIASDPDWTPTTPMVRSASLLNTGNSAHTDFGLTANGIVHRLLPTLSNGTMRCNEGVRYWVSVQNTGNKACDVQLALDLDDLTGFTGSVPAANVVGGIAYWNYPNVQPTHHRYIEVVVQLAGPDHLGDTLHDVLTASAFDGGVLEATHLATTDPVLLCAMDPNDKQVLPQGTGEEQWTPMGSLLTYTVRFQNMGNAPANDVEIVDQLDADLDLSSLQVIAASHTMRTIADPSGEIRFRFEDIQLPDSASDPAGSQGYVRFAVRHQQGLPEATEVFNTAAIYFDLNPPIITNTVLNTMTYGTVGTQDITSMDGALAVYPNPAGETSVVTLAAEVLGRVELVLTDAMGRQVRSWSTQGGTSTILERAGLPAGIYLLRAAGGGVDRTLRLVFE